jgi:hypothetical protein
MNLFSDALTAISILLISFGIAIGLSVIWMLLVQYCHGIMIWIAFILAIVLLIFIAVVLFTNAGSTLLGAKGWAIFAGVLALIIALLIIFYIIIHRKRIKYCSAFLKNAAQMIS